MSVKETVKTYKFFHIQTTEMKYSYKSDTIQSSVVVLRDGRAMEVRRGKDTYFAGKDRQMWASVDVWISTLPAGAKVEITGKSHSDVTVTNPVLIRFLERTKAGCGSSYRIPMETMHYHGTRMQVLEKSRGMLDGLAPRPTVSVKITELITEGKADLPVFRSIRTSRHLAINPSGELCEVRYSRKDNAIGYFSMHPCSYWYSETLGERFVPLTEPEMPLWINIRGPVKI